MIDGAVTIDWQQLQAGIVAVFGVGAAVVGLRTRTVRSLRDEIHQLRKDLEWERGERERDQKRCDDKILKLHTDLASANGRIDVLVGGIGKEIASAVIAASGIIEKGTNT